MAAVLSLALALRNWSFDGCVQRGGYGVAAAAAVPGAARVGVWGDPAVRVGVCALRRITRHGRDNSVFREFAAIEYQGGRPVIPGSSDPVEIRATRVSHDFLGAPGVLPAMGRTFHELPNGPKAVLLTDSLWRNHVGAAATSLVDPIIALRTE
jgi:hypothetical protein